MTAAEGSRRRPGRRRGLLVAAAVVGVTALTVGLAVALDPTSDEVRSVILVNGDGMGAAHREAATLAQEGLSGSLAMDRLPVQGAQRTEPDDPEAIVTDSAAAATAWATGQKTANRRISTTADGQALVPLGLEVARAGKATGLVTTSTVTDASPAAFFSSTPDRREEGVIAAQYLEPDGPDVVLGGGAAVWSQDLLDAAEQDGYAVLDDPAQLGGTDGGRVLGLFDDQSLWRAADEGEGAVYDPPVSLAEMTADALRRLSEDEDGFFLFVEEEGVDAMSHEQNGTLTLTAMAALDEAVQVARDYVAEHPDTLLIVTGDHETGGLTVEDEDGGGEDGPFPVAGSDRQFAIDWTTGDHTSVPTPVTAQGPGSERLAGAYQNTHLHTVLREALLGD